MTMSESTERRSPSERSMYATSSLACAALEIIAQCGMSGLTLGAVSERAGVSRGLPIYHFGSKTGLIHHLLDDAIQSRLRWMTCVQSTGLDAIGEVLESLYHRVELNPLHTRGHSILMAEGALSGDPEIRERVIRYNRTMRAFFTKCFDEELAKGSVGFKADPHLLAANFIGTLRGVTSQWMVEGEEFDFFGAVRTMQRMIFEVFRPTSGGHKETPGEIMQMSRVPGEGSSSS